MATGAISSSVSSMTETDRRIEEFAGNIANVQTSGYKGFEAHAQTVVNASGKSAGGVVSTTRQLIDHQGSMTKTAIGTDLAISGAGFFVVTDKVDETGKIENLYFTREGSFRRDSLGRFVNGANYLLVGWPLDASGELPETKSLPSSLSLVDVKQLISEASSTTKILLSANLNSDQRVAGGGVATINILGSGLKSSPDNFNIGKKDILFPNKENALTKGDGIKLTKYVPDSLIKTESILEYGGFAESISFVSSGTDLVQNGGTKLSTHKLQFQVNDIKSPEFTRGSGASNKEVLENLAEQINEKSTGDYSVKARVVTHYEGGVLKSSLLIAPDKSHYSLTMLGDSTFRNDVGLNDEKNIKAFITPESNKNLKGRFASLEDLEFLLNKESVEAKSYSSDSVGTTITFSSVNPLFIENSGKGDFMSEFGIKQGYLSSNYDPYDSFNNIAGGKFKSHFSQDIEVYDSMGNKHVMIVAFLKLDTNRWAVEAFSADSSKVNIPGRTDGLLQSGILTFDGRGNLQSSLSMPQISKTKDVASPHLALGATIGQKFEVDVSAGTTSERKTFYYGSMIADSDLFSATGTDLVGTSTDQLVLTYKISATDPGQVFNITRGTGTTDLAVLKNIANQINTTSTLRDLVRADIVFENSKYKIDIRPIDSTKYLEFSESPATTLGTDLNITSSDNIKGNSFISLYDLAEQINKTDGPFALSAEVITGTVKDTYRLKIQPKNPSLSMTFGGDTAIIGTPVGTGVNETIAEALDLKNTSASSQIKSLDESIVINWSAIVGADPNIVTVNYGDIGTAGGIGQVSGNYSIRSKEADGWSTGQLNSITVDADGYLVAGFTNSRTRKIFKLAIADFANRNGLTAMSGNVFSASKDSGPFNLKEAGQDGVGTILSYTLEGSNADTADQLTKLILAQRQYQASAKVISVVDKLQEDLLHRTFNT